MAHNDICLIFTKSSCWMTWFPTGKQSLQARIKVWTRNINPHSGETYWIGLQVRCYPTKTLISLVTISESFDLQNEAIEIRKRFSAFCPHKRLTAPDSPHSTAKTPNKQHQVHQFATWSTKSPCYHHLQLRSLIGASRTENLTAMARIR